MKEFLYTQADHSENKASKTIEQCFCMNAIQMSNSPEPYRKYIDHLLHPTIHQTILLFCWRTCTTLPAELINPVYYFVCRPFYCVTINGRQRKKTQICLSIERLLICVLFISVLKSPSTTIH